MEENLLIEIEQYLADELSAVERSAFESRMQSEPEFAAHVEAVREILLGIEVEGDNQLRNQVTQVLKDYKKSRQEVTEESKTIIRTMESKNTQTGKWWLVAASAVIVLGLGYYYFMPGQDMSMDDVYAEYYSPDQEGAQDLIDNSSTAGLVDSTKGRKDTLVQALVSYRSDKYQQAISMLSVYSVNYPEDIEAKYFLGLSYLAIENYNRAVEVLQPLLQSDDYEVMDDARYYLALSYTRFVDNEDNTIKLLEQIVADPDSSWKQEADNMLGFIK